ncbi:hypothetical protein GCM10017083_38470 [Thalassobaculum fulvum]|uniref:2OG-Fe(II) oxygenase superfamily protein n=1 Tax=Thalassobaculum fulvum TaxID=1633335 RepID=A0A918XUI4_9PROT|nr:hypothetical protein [Thalassobaculum fulvum]GHD57249.1 hypothetical protein GCM10017083_38470 [Thalassobaculum fulvum]
MESTAALDAFELADSTTWSNDLLESDVEHVVGRIRSCSLAGGPFDHLIVPDFLPADLFAGVGAALADMPTGFQRSSAVLTAYQVPVRHLTPATRRLRAVLTDHLVAQTVLDTFAHVLAPLMDDGRHPGGWPAITPQRIFPRVELMRDTEAMVLPPHTDSHGRLVAALVYFPVSGGGADLGTRFYRPLDPALSCDGRRCHDFSQFEEAGRAPYAANSLCLFARTDTSFHGLPALARGSDRRAVQWSLLRNGHF